MNPLADRIRPDSIDDVVGQKHLLGKGKLLRRIIEKNEIPNMIFYGPSGVGKTTVAKYYRIKNRQDLKKAKCYKCFGKRYKGYSSVAGFVSRSQRRFALS